MGARQGGSVASGSILAVLVLAALSSCPSIISGDKEITSFAFLKADNPGLAADYAGVITGTDIAVSMPFYEDRSGLVATFATTGALVEVGTMEQASGQDAHDFTVPVTYRVTASDATFQDYLVVVGYGEKKITASDAAGDDRFGGDVSLSDDFLVVGAMGDDTKGDSAGAVYIYRRTGGTNLGSCVKLVASDGEAQDWYGEEAAIDGDFIIVGAEGDDDGGDRAGAAYVYMRTDENAWDSVVKLVAASPSAGDCFGTSVSISGDYAIVGAEGDGDGGYYAGAAYVFHRGSGNSWDAGCRLVAPDAEASDIFGCAVSLYGDYAVVGASGGDADGVDCGAAYVFRRTGDNAWGSVCKLVAPDPEADDGFGQSVAIDGDYIVIAAGGEDTGGSNAGAAYVFHRTGDNTWDAGVKLVAPDAGLDDGFEMAVSIQGDCLVTGAPFTDEGGTGTGAVYAYRRLGINAWSSGTKLFASDAEPMDHFGLALSVCGESAAIGAPEEDAGGTDAGAVYLLD